MFLKQLDGVDFVSELGVERVDLPRQQVAIGALAHPGALDPQLDGSQVGLDSVVDGGPVVDLLVEGRPLVVPLSLH